MPQHTTSQKKRRTPLRRCATCNRIGHNARTCEEQTTVIPSAILDLPHKKNISATEKLKGVSKKKNRTSTSGTVVIQVTSDAPPVSRHVVSLKNETLEKAWKNIEVYRPGQHKRQSRGHVNFAELVHNANQPHADEDHIKKPTVDILKEIARIEGGYDQESEFKITPRAPHEKVVTHGKTVLKKQSAVKQKLSARFFSFKNSIAGIKEKAHHAFHFKKFAITLLILSLLGTLPFPVMGFYHNVENNTAKIVAESTNAFLSLQSSTVAAFNQNLLQAETDLTSALNSFGNARVLVDKEYKALVYVLDLLPIVGTKIQSRQDLLEAGHYLALGNAYLIKGINEAVSKNDSNTIDRLKTLRVHIRGALPQYDEAIKRLDGIEPTALPAEYQAPFGEFRDLFHGLVSDIKNVSDVISGLELMLGSDGFKRYLIVFQNQYELRPTGGFIGSFATLDVQNGKILNVDVPGGGSYDLQGQLGMYIKPPLPLQLVNDRWEFQDANWFPDFKASGEKLAWFYQKSRNTSVDGVIAINASVLERLLRVIGPIQNDQYNLMLNSESAIKNLSYTIDSYENTDGANTPKAVLSVLLSQIMDVIHNIKPEQLISLVTELSDALDQREIQTYFTNTQLQSLVRSYGWTGELTQTDPEQDYLMVVNSNIGGGKSDVSIQQSVQHQAVIDVDGNIMVTVVITRTHEGTDDESSPFEQVNSSYVRVYVPQGSELVDAGGFVYPDESSFHIAQSWYKDDPDLASVEHEESIHAGTGTRIVNEFGKTSFGNWMVTYPGQQSQVYFTYRLPFKAFDKVVLNESNNQGIFSEYMGKIASFARDHSKKTSRYSIVIQKQSGITSDYEDTIIYPDGWSPIWKTNDELSLSRNGASIYGILDSDKVFGIVMKQ